jgi:hypothetical protein
LNSYYSFEADCFPSSVKAEAGGENNHRVGIILKEKGG